MGRKRKENYFGFIMDKRIHMREALIKINNFQKKV